MLKNRNIKNFLRPIVPYTRAFSGIPIPGEEKSHGAEELKNIALQLGIKKSFACKNIFESIKHLNSLPYYPSKCLIIGSLYLIGTILKNHR